MEPLDLLVRPRYVLRNSPVAARLDPLTPAERQLIQHAAVVGRTAGVGPCAPSLVPITDKLNAVISVL
jgi:hypothetical protein